MTSRNNLLAPQYINRYSTPQGTKLFEEFDTGTLSLAHDHGAALPALNDLAKLVAAKIPPAVALPKTPRVAGAHWAPYANENEAQDSYSAYRATVVQGSTNLLGGAWQELLAKVPDAVAKAADTQLPGAARDQPRLAVWELLVSFINDDPSKLPVTAASLPNKIAAIKMPESYAPEGNWKNHLALWTLRQAYVLILAKGRNP